MTWAAMSEAWVRRFMAGEIVFDPRKVEARWVPAEGDGTRGFRVILNASRKARLLKAA
jgi:hypothetical protein